jgi:hypothetical protein
MRTMQQTVAMLTRAPKPIERARPRMAKLMAAALVFAATAAGAMPSPDALSLRSQHASLRDALARSPFHRPLLVQSAEAADELRGEIYAVVDQPFDTTAQVLTDKARWCDVMMLHQNVKRCRSDGGAADGTLGIVIGRKAEHTPEQGYKMDFTFGVPASAADFVRVQLSAAAGPLGTRDHRVTLRAAPLDAKRSFIHMSYAYEFGGLARLATQAYLATAGRDKVGFTVAGRTEDGQPVYINGVRAMLERTAMRYYLAIEACLGALAAPAAQQQDKRLHDWFDLTEQHPRQLRELRRDEYLAIKRRDLATL